MRNIRLIVLAIIGSVFINSAAFGVQDLTPLGVDQGWFDVPRGKVKLLPVVTWEKDRPILKLTVENAGDQILCFSSHDQWGRDDWQKYGLKSAPMRVMNAVTELFFYPQAGLSRYEEWVGSEGYVRQIRLAPGESWSNEYDLKEHYDIFDEAFSTMHYILYGPCTETTFWPDFIRHMRTITVERQVLGREARSAIQASYDRLAKLGLQATVTGWIKHAPPK